MTLEFCCTLIAALLLSTACHVFLLFSQGKKGKLLGVMGADVPISEIVDMVPTHKVRARPSRVRKQ